MNRMQKVARDAALALLEEGDKKKKWTPGEKNDWTRAFNALQRLSGHKIRMVKGELVNTPPVQKNTG